MSWEEDYLLRRVDELTAAMKGAGVLEECDQCTTLYAADLDKCPNCGKPKGESADPAVATPRPTPLGVESTAGANALPAATVHGGADPNEVTRRDDSGGEDGDTSDEFEDDAPAETIKGEPSSYEAANVETLRAELTDHRQRFIPGVSSKKKAELVELLREDDKRTATDATHGS